MSLDEEEHDEKIDIVLTDSKLSLSKTLFNNHPVLSNLGNSDGYKHQIDLSLSDFLPILNHLVAKPIVDKSLFFKTCQYLGEIDLPIIQSKNSELLQKWALSPRKLIQCELELFVLSIYSKMDKGISFNDAREETLKTYINSEMNHKLNEKTGGKLLQKLQTFECHSLIIVLSDDVSESHTVNEPIYPTIKCETKWWKPYFSNKYSIRNGLIILNKKFKNFPFHYPTIDGFCVLAGGGVLRQIVTEEVHSYYYSDNDIFLITRDESEAIFMIRMIHEWVEDISKGRFFITRTKNAITFMTEKHGIFQIITRLYHDIVQLLSGFDLAPCCFAYTGENIVTIESGLDCIKTNQFPLLCWKQSETMAWRCRKMRMRRFAITIPGLTMEEFEREMTLETKNSKSILKKIIHGEGSRGSDYDEPQFKTRDLQWMIRKIQHGLEFGYANQIQLITIDINVVIDTINLNVNDSFTLINVDESNTKLKFIKEMSHGQQSGSFNPTNTEFFEGIKW